MEMGVEQSGTVSAIRVITFKGDYSLRRRALVVCRLCRMCWAERLTGLPFLSSTLLQRTHDEIALLHCFLWPVVAFVVGVLIVVLTICAKSLAVKAEAMKKRKFS